MRPYRTCMNLTRRDFDDMMDAEEIAQALEGDYEKHQEKLAQLEKEVEEGNEKPSREWTVIVYLNDDYSGGETYFPPSDYYPFGTQIEQEVGSGVLFQGIYHGQGVFKVRRGYRHTVSVWFTEDIEKAMTQRPVSDLGYNENTIRGNLNFNLDDGLFQSDVTQDKQKWIDYKRKSLQNFK